MNEYSLDGSLNQLKTCSLYKLMVLINAANGTYPSAEYTTTSAPLCTGLCLFQ